MADRRTLPIPIPGPELQRMQETLAPRYGSEVWEQGGHKILVIRTPGPDPDIVNDLERAVEYLLPSDIHDLDHCLLIGDRRTTAVSTAPLARLMDDRLAHDQAMADLLRQKIPGRTGHAVHRDTKRLDRMVRLGVRIAKPRAQDIDDEDLDILAAELGPRLGIAPLSEVRALHIIADQDDVRIDADLLLSDLRRRFEEEDNVARRANEEEAARQAREAERRAQREQIVAVLKRKYDHDDEAIRPRISHRPSSPTESTADAAEARSGSRRALLDAELDRIPTRTRTDPTPGPLGTPEPAVAAVSLVDAAEQALRTAGYETLRRPDVPGHRIDLAAERDAAPARVIVQVAPRLALPEADAILAACRAVTAELGLVVAPEADEDARERLVATKAKWVRPDDLATLRL